MKTITNFNKESVLLTNKFFAVSSSGIRLNFAVPSVYDIIVNDNGVSSMIAMFKKDGSEARKIFKMRPALEESHGNLYLDLLSNEEFKEQLLEPMNHLISVESVEDILKEHGRKKTLEILDEVLLMIIKSTTSNLEDDTVREYVPADFSHVEDPMMRNLLEMDHKAEWESKHGSSKKKNEEETEEGSDHDGVHGMIRSIMEAFSMTFKEIQELNMYTFYWLYFSALRIDIHKMTRISYGNGLVDTKKDKNKRYKYTLDKK